jgi:hypothetical protein
MKRTVRAVAVLSYLAALAAPAAAIYRGGCEAFDRGTEILGNITERYYGPEIELENLHGWFLKLTEEDAQAAASIAKARFKKDEPKCKDLAATVDKLASAYTAVAKQYEAAKKPCQSFPKEGDEGACLAAVGPALKAEKAARDPAGPLGAYVSATKAHPECFTLSGLDGSQGDEGVGTEVMLYERMAKQPCERDNRCYSTRLGKMRESQVYFARAGKASPSTFSTNADDIALRAVFYDDVKPLLLNGEGGSCTNPDAGSEGIVWCLRDHPEIDNTLLFVATKKLAQAMFVAKTKGLTLCSHVLDAD